MEVRQGLVETVAAHELRHCRRLTAGDHHPGQAGEVFRQPYLDPLGAAAFKRPTVLTEVALQRENTYALGA